MPTIRATPGRSTLRAELADRLRADLAQDGVSVSPTDGGSGALPADGWDAKTQARARSTIASYYENVWNDRRQGKSLLTTDVDPQFRFGNRFDVPLVPMGKHGALLATEHAFVGHAAARALLAADPSHVAMPVHPQMADARRAGQRRDVMHRFRPHVEQSVSVRTAASERTVRAVVDGHELLLKLDLADIENTHFIRPISVADARRSLAATDVVASYLDAHPQLAHQVAIEPEIAAAVDTRADYAAVVRDSQPYPPHPSGQTTWLLRMYSLTAATPEHVEGRPLLAELIDHRPDRSVDPVTYAIDKVFRPLLAAALTIHVDLGAATNLHMQNSALEIGEDGHPTGRVVVSDMEDIHFRPHSAEWRAAVDRAGLTEVLNDDASFKSFDHWVMAHNVNEFRRSFDAAFPETGGRLRARINEVLREELEQRRSAVEGGAGVEPKLAALLVNGPRY